MKKILTFILASVFVVSFAACSKDASKDTKQTTTTNSAQKKDEFKPREVTKFADILDNLANKDNFFADSTVIKVTIKTADYTAKVNPIVENAMKEKNVDMKNTKTYQYYKNIKANKEHKVYVVVFDASKAPTDMYEVNMTVNEKDEPALKEVKKVENAINDAFKTQFAKEVK
jgi:hypothetical protein